MQMGGISREEAKYPYSYLAYEFYVYVENTYGISAETVEHYLLRLSEYPEICSGLIIEEYGGTGKGEKAGAEVAEKILQGFIDYFPKLRKRQEIKATLEDLIEKYGKLY